MQPLGADAGFLFDVDSDRVAMADRARHAGVRGDDAAAARRLPAAARRRASW